MPNKETNPPKVETPGRVIAHIEKHFGRGSIMCLADRATVPVAVIPSGCRALDEALGVGGYPQGRIVEVFGPESSGKTTLTLHAIAQAQNQGKLSAFIDAEHAFDPHYAERIGVNLKELLVSQPDCGEQALDIAEMLTRTAAVGLIVVDSVAALVPRSEIDGDMGASHMGLQARLMSQALRKLAAIASKSGTTLIFINQLRQKIGVTFGNPETTPGGTAMKYYSTVRLDVRRIGKVQVQDEVIGNRTRVRVVKNKVAPPFAEAEFDVRWGTGIDETMDLVDTALRKGVLEKSGAHLLLKGKSIGQGRERSRQALLENAELRKKLEIQLGKTTAKQAA